MSSAANPQSSRTTEWWLAVDGQADGPHSHAYVARLLETGRAAPDQLACPVGGNQWQRLTEWPQFARVLRLRPPAPTLEPAHPLINPRLPRFANWICIYGIVVAPTYWGVNLVSLLLVGTPFLEQGFWVIFALLSVASLFFSLGVTVLLVLGGIRLRDLRRSGVRLLKVAIWADFAKLALLLLSGTILLLIVIAENAFTDTGEPSGAADLISYFEMLLGLGCFVFEVIALAWLIRVGPQLPLVSD